MSAVFGGLALEQFEQESHRRSLVPTLGLELGMRLRLSDRWAMQLDVNGGVGWVQLQEGPTALQFVDGALYLVNYTGETVMHLDIE